MTTTEIQHFSHQESKAFLSTTPVFQEADTSNHKAVSPAVNEWHKQFLRAASSLNWHPILFGHRPEPIFPKGPIVSRFIDSAEFSFPTHPISLLNVPCLRQFHMRISYKRKAKQLAIQKHPVFCFFYNLQPFTLPVAKALKNMNVRPVLFVGDVPADQNGEPNVDPELFLVFHKVVFFSYYLYKKKSFESNALHFEGGIKPLFKNYDDTYRNASSTNGATHYLYAGGLDKFSGIDILVEAWRRIPPESNVRLTICGKGKHPAVEELATYDKRVRYLGMVKEQTLHHLCREAHFFLNPRPTNLKETQFNFPSKLLMYLSYGKPIISSWTASLAPKYRHLLIVADSDRFGKDISKAITYTASWPSSRYERFMKLLRDEVLKMEWTSKVEHFFNTL